MVNIAALRGDARRGRHLSNDPLPPVQASRKRRRGTAAREWGRRHREQDDSGSCVLTNDHVVAGTGVSKSFCPMAAHCPHGWSGQIQTGPAGASRQGLDTHHAGSVGKAQVGRWCWPSAIRSGGPDGDHGIISAAMDATGLGGTATKIFIQTDGDQSGQPGGALITMERQLSSASTASLLRTEDHLASGLSSRVDGQGIMEKMLPRVGNARLHRHQPARM